MAKKFLFVNQDGDYQESFGYYEKVAASNVGSGRVLTVNSNGEVLHADNLESIDRISLIGISRQSATIGNTCEIARNGEDMQDSGWQWVTGSPIFLGENGVMTQTIPDSGFVVIVAFPLTSTEISIDIKQPIQL